MLASAAHDSWTHRLVRPLVRPLVDSAVTPNHLTTARLISGLAACAAFAAGARSWEIWGGVLWVLSAFLDRADGELARLGATTSARGHRYDFLCDVLVNGLVFVAIGVGLRDALDGPSAILLGVVAGLSVAAAGWLCEELEQRQAGTVKAYAGRGGFDLDDLLYVFGPLAWLGWLPPLLIGASIGGPLFALWAWIRLRKVPAPGDARAPDAGREGRGRHDPGDRW